MFITDFISEKYILPDLVSEDKEELFAELVEILVRVHPELDRDQLKRALSEREVKLSTGIGKGVAIPHGKTDAVDDLYGVIGVSRAGIDYDALDNEPVHVVFMLLGPASAAGRHIKALQRIANLMKDRGCYQRIFEAGSASAIWQILRNDEERLIEAGE